MLGRLGLKLFLFGLFAFIIIYHFFTDFWIKSWVAPVCWGLMGVGFILWFVFSIEWIITWVQKRSSQFGISVVLSAVGLVGIMAVVNWAAIQGENLYPKALKKDVTRNQAHSLSPQSLKVLKTLPEKITLEVWTFNLKDMSASHDMSRFLDNYVQNSGGKLSLKIRNPNAERLDAIQSKVTRKDVIIAKAESGRESRIENFNDGKAEEQITNAIIQAVKGRKKILCFLGGHGELEANGGSNPQQTAMSISELRSSLESSSYSVRDITLATEKNVPTDCEMIASIGPRTAPSDTEIKLLSAYLAQGGKMMAMWGLETPLAWQQVIAPYGVKLDNNILIDERVQGAPAVYTKNFAVDNDLGRSLTQPVVFALARSISTATAAPPPGVSVKPIVNAEEGTLAKEGDLKSLKGGVISRKSLQSANGKAVAVEIKKPVAAGTVAEKPSADKAPEAKETDIIVIGNNMVASNGLIVQYGNMDFVLNSFSYLLKDTDLIGIRPRDVKTAKLELTMGRMKGVQGYLLLSTLAFLVMAMFTAFGRKTTLVENRG